MYWIDVSQWLVWYYVLIVIVILVSIWALIKHKEALPFMWGILLSVVLFILAPFITPIFLGVFTYYNTDWYLFALMLWLTIVWLGWIILCLYNMIKHDGKVLT
jgi:hypothetical protein